jgi:hypothetical protein
VKSRTLELTTAGIVVAAWWLAVHSVQSLPLQIPTHFRLDGTPDRMGSVRSLWLLPAALTGSYAFLSVAQRIPPRLRNDPVRITDLNRQGVYALGSEMLAAIKLCTVLTLLGVEWGCIDAANRGSLGPSFMAATFAPIVLLFGVSIYYTIKIRSI